MADGYLAGMIEQFPLAILVFRPDGRFVLANAAWNELWHPPEENGIVEDQNIFEDGRIRAMGLVPYIEESMDGAVKTPLLLHDPALNGHKGTTRWLRAFIRPVKDDNGRVVETVLVLEDDTERKALEERLEHQAYHDSLTGMPNRALFMDRLEQALARTGRSGDKVAILFMDLDDFKHINDSLGHRAGDLLLIEIARRLRTCLRPEDTVARFGGDEFIILLEDLEDVDDATDVAERIAQALYAPFIVDGHEVFATASIGIVLGSYPRDRAEDLLRSADVAMYRSKYRGKNRHEIFALEMNGHSLNRLSLEADLRRALEHEELRVHYQPRVLLGTGKIVGLEALVRWEHPERGLILPEEFVPLAEETGLIVKIGWWVLKESCLHMRTLQRLRPGDSPLKISVNISPRQFRHPELVQEVAEVLRETAIDSRDLILEVTESVAMEDVPSTTTIFRGLKGLGVKLELDDFGVGYSSLSYLKRFPVDALKIDRSLIEGVDRDSGDEAIVSAMIALAHALGIAVVAEGVETAGQVAKLRLLEGDLGQGYYWWRPCSAEKSVALLATTSTRSLTDI